MVAIEKVVHLCPSAGLTTACFRGINLAVKRQEQDSVQTVLL
jgi:hypothetical protein